MLAEVRDHLARSPLPETVTFILFDAVPARVFQEAFEAERSPSGRARGAEGAAAG